MVESPIEKMMADAFAATIPAGMGLKPGDAIAAPGAYDLFGVMADPTISTVRLYQEVTVDRYRLDFLLRYKTIFGHIVMIGVECDGHEYHDRSSDDAARDKSRDRFLSGLGITMLRFTGREIWRDANGCAVEAFRVLESRAEAFVDAAVQIAEDLRK